MFLSSRLFRKCLIVHSITEYFKNKSGALIKTPINRSVHKGMPGRTITPMGASANADQNNRYSPHVTPRGSSADIVSGSLQNSGEVFYPAVKITSVSRGIVVAVALYMYVVKKSL